MVYWFDFVYSPPGFYGKDIAIDVLSAVVVLLIGVFSFRNFFLDEDNKKHIYISLGYLLLGASFIAKIITSLLSHNQELMRGSFTLFGDSVYSYTALPALGFLLYAFLTLFGFYMLYSLTSKERLTMNYVIIAYFILVSVFFSRFNYHLLYLSAMIFLVAVARRYYLAYRKYGNSNTLFLAKSFGLIAVSQLMFLFTYQSRALYMAAEIIQLLGYGALLFTFLRVLKHAGKKNKD